MSLAKDILQSYDVVVITEWMNNKTHIDFINDALSGNIGSRGGSRSVPKIGVHKVKGDYNARVRLGPKLMPNKGVR